MAVHSYYDLKSHIGHKVEVVAYGTIRNPANVAIECTHCHTVLLDFDKPPRKTKAEKIREGIEERRGDWDFDDKNFCRADWQIEAGRGDTQLGYIDWVLHKYEAAEESGIKL